MAANNAAMPQVQPVVANQTQRITERDVQVLHNFFMRQMIEKVPNFKKRKKECIEGILKLMTHLNNGQVDRQIISYIAKLDYRKELGGALLRHTMKMISGEVTMVEDSILHILSKVYKDCSVSTINALPDHLAAFLSRCNQICMLQDAGSNEEAQLLYLPHDAKLISQFRDMFQHVLLHKWAQMWSELAAVEGRAATSSNVLEKVETAVADLEHTLFCHSTIQHMHKE